MYRLVEYQTITLALVRMFIRQVQPLVLSTLRTTPLNSSFIALITVIRIIAVSRKDISITKYLEHMDLELELRNFFTNILGMVGRQIYRMEII
jgi:hypothetical protein